MILFRAIRVLWHLFPLLAGFLRDQRVYFFFGPPRRLSPEQSAARAVQLRRSCVALGPSFIKAAQVLAQRVDTIPEVYCLELRKLQDRVPPFPYRQVRGILMEHLGEAPEMTFDAFDAEPIAAASLGQVHKAVYRGQEVAVKVLRPGVRRLIRQDLLIASAILRVVRSFYDNNITRSLRSILEEFRRVIAEEMDLAHEADNMARLRRNLAGDERVIVPETIDELTRPEVLVTHFHHGCRIDDRATLAAWGVNPMNVLTTLVEVYSRMAVLDGFVHADPHPGNLLVQRDERIVILDHGMAVSLKPEIKNELLKLALAGVRKDVNGLVDGFYRLRMVGPEANMSVLRDAARVLANIQYDSRLDARQIQAIVTDIARTFSHFPLIMPQSLVYLFRASSLLEGIGLSLDPKFNSVQFARPIVRRMLMQVLREEYERRSPLDRLLDRARELGEFLENLGRVIYRADREELRIRAHPADRIELERYLRTLIRRNIMMFFTTGFFVASILFYVLEGSPLYANHLLFALAQVVAFCLVVAILFLPPRRG